MATVNSQMSHVFEELTPSASSTGLHHSPRKKTYGSSAGRRRSYQSESASSNARVVSESSESEVHPHQDGVSAHNSSPSKSKLGWKSGTRKRNNKRLAERVLICIRKRQKKTVPSESESIVSGSLGPRDMKLRSNTHNDSNDASSSSRNKILKPTTVKKSRKKGSLQKSFNSAPVDVHNESSDEMSKETSATDADECSRKEFVDENICKPENGCKSWKVIEKSLFAKGLEIFGRNRSVNITSVIYKLMFCYG